MRLAAPVPQNKTTKTKLLHGRINPLLFFL